jgi:hypothetical protein
MSRSEQLTTHPRAFQRHQLRPPPSLAGSRPLAPEFRETSRRDGIPTHPRGNVGPFGSRFLFCGCRTPSESARATARFLGGDSSSSQRVLVCATGRNSTRRPRPRVPHVRGGCARALLRGVSRKGRDAWVAAPAKASTCTAHGARPRSSTTLRRKRHPEMERGGRLSTCGSRFPFGGSQARYEARSSNDAGPSRLEAGHRSSTTRRPGNAGAEHNRRRLRKCDAPLSGRQRRLPSTDGGGVSGERWPGDDRPRHPRLAC